MKFVSLAHAIKRTTHFVPNFRAIAQGSRTTQLYPTIAHCMCRFDFGSTHWRVCLSLSESYTETRRVQRGAASKSGRSIDWQAVLYDDKICYHW